LGAFDPWGLSGIGDEEVFYHYFKTRHVLQYLG